MRLVDHCRVIEVEFSAMAKRRHNDDGLECGAPTRKTAVHVHDVRCLIRTVTSNPGTLKAMLKETPALLGKTTSRGETALHWLVVENNIEAVRVLIAHGAAIDTAANAGDTPLISAARLGLIAMSRILVENGADVRRADENGDTVLHHAAQSGAADLVEFLVQSGADPAARNSLGATPVDRPSLRKRGLIAQALGCSAG